MGNLAKEIYKADCGKQQVRLLQRQKYSPSMFAAEGREGWPAMCVYPTQQALPLCEHYTLYAATCISPNLFPNFKFYIFKCLYRVYPGLSRVYPAQHDLYTTTLQYTYWITNWITPHISLFPRTYSTIWNLPILVCSSRQSSPCTPQSCCFLPKT